MGQELNNWIVAIVRPPLIALRFVIEKLYSLLFAWWLDKRLVTKDNERFASDIRQYLNFLFADYGAKIIPNDQEPPASFDFALVTISGDGLLFRFFRGRGDISVSVASSGNPNEWHELSRVLGVMDVAVQPQTLSHLMDIERVLRLHMSDIRRALSEDYYPQIKEQLSDIYSHDQAVTRQWETEINRRLYPDK